MSGALDKLGGTSYDEIGCAFDALMADATVGAIVLHVDSPGGCPYGLQELADKIYQARSSGKKVYAIADSLACSAAYWLASAAEQFVCTPGGDVGSIGVYAIHVDKSEQAQQEGLKVTIISAGKYKTEMLPFGPLADEAQAAAQARVDADYGVLDALRLNRGTTLDDVRKNYGQGRMVRLSRHWRPAWSIASCRSTSRWPG